MTMNALYQMGILPVVLVTLAGLLVLHKQDEEKARQRFFLFLLLVNVLLLLAIFFTQSPPGAPYRPLSFELPTLLTPTILSIVAIILLNLKLLSSMNRRSKITAVFLGLVMLILFGLLWNSRLGLSYLILPNALALAIGWRLGSRHVRLAVTLSLFALVTLYFYAYIFQNQPDSSVIALFSWLRFLLLPAFLAAPALLVGMPALFITRWLQQRGDGQQSMSTNFCQRSFILHFVLSLLLLGSLVYMLFWWAIWDQTQDMGVGLLALPMVGVTAVAAGMIMTISLPGKYRIAGLLYLLVVPLLLYQVYAIGSNISHHEITEGRAAHIAQALEQFKEREGDYPETLTMLTPRDLLLIRQPIILPGEKWCYQGKENFYRLAAFHREFFSSPVSLQVYAASGEPPPGSWECEEQLAAMKERYYSPMDDPAAMRPPLPTPLPEIEVGITKTAVSPVLDDIPVAVGSWSPDSNYFVFGTKNGVTTLHFLNGKTGEVCATDEQFAAVETLREHHAWLPDGRLLYLDSGGEMVVFTPCQPEAERLTGRFPETFVQIGPQAPENGRTLMQSEGAYWILDGRTLTLQAIPDVTPNPYDLHWDAFTWLPGGEKLVIARLNGRRDGNEGSPLYLIAGDTGQVKSSLLLAHDSGQSAGWIEGLSEHEILMYSSGALVIVDFSTDPPQSTDVLADIFGLDIEYPNETSASTSFVDPEGRGYYLAVRLNHPRNQATYLYHSETGRTDVYDHENHTLLLGPDGEVAEMPLQENVPTYQDVYDVVLVDKPEATQPRLTFTGHTPRDYAHLSLRYLPQSSQIAVASAHGISLVSLPEGEMVAYWELPGAGFSPWLIAAPDGASLVAVKDYGGLYYIPLP